jgi:hypothetical protein
MTARGPKLPRCTYEIKSKGQLQLVEAAPVSDLAAHLVTAGLDQDTATSTAYLLAHHKARVTTSQWSVRWVGKVKKPASPPSP